MAWLPPGLDVGEEPELKPLDPELELELFELEELPELDPVELEPEEVEPVEAEPEPVEDEPELAEDELDDPVEAEPVEPVVCVEPGRTKARAPAVTTLAMVTAVVVDRTLARPRSRAAWAWRIPSFRRVLLMSLILRPRTRKSLHEPSGSAMSQRVLLTRAGRGYPGNMKDT